VPRYYFDFRTIHGVIERDATGVLAPNVGTAIYGCIGAILELIDDAADVESLSVRCGDGEMFLLVNLHALRAALLQDEQ
jgi:hypothetical protein